MALKVQIVTPNDDLGAAIAQAPKKGTLILKNGVYRVRQCLVVDKTLTLKSESGNPSDVKLVRQGSTALLVIDGKPTFEGITFLATQGDGNKTDVDRPVAYEGAVAVREKGAPVFINCQASSIEKSAFSIRGKKARIKLDKCRIQDVGEAGVYFQDQSSGLIEDSFIANSDQAPYLHDNPDMVGCGCVEVEEESFAEVRRSTLISGPNRAVIIHNVGSAKLLDCVVSAPAHQCVWLQENSRLTAINTEFTSCARKTNVEGIEMIVTDGVYLHDSYAEFKKCRFHALRCGIALIINSKAKTRELSFQDVAAPYALPDNASKFIFMGNDTQSGITQNYDFGVSGSSEGLNSQNDDEEFSEEEQYKANLVRDGYFQELLNEPSKVVVHTPPFFDEGGRLTGFYYPNSKYGGTFMVSKELVKPDFKSPGNALFQSYELAIATRETLPFGEKAASQETGINIINSKSEDNNALVKYLRLNKILSYFGHAVEYGAVLDRFKTTGIPEDHPDKELAGSYFIIDALDLRKNAAPRTSFAIIDRLPEEFKQEFEEKHPGIIQMLADVKRPDNREDSRPYFGLMVLIEISYSELVQIMTKDYREAFINDLKAANQWPFSDLDKRTPLF